MTLRPMANAAGRARRDRVRLLGHLYPRPPLAFSRAVWRLYGGAKGLAVWYQLEVERVEAA